jgi:aquaporin NIP
MRKLAAEAFGTFALVFAGTGAIVVDDLYGGVTHVGVSLTFGLVVLTLIYALGDVSGAHLNPAVTVGFFLARRFEVRFVLPYVVSQVAGAVLASLLLRLLFPAHQTLGATEPAGTAWQSFVLEVLLTLLLMMVILSVSSGAKEKSLMAGIAIGSVIALEALFAGPVCGASMNPARSLAPAIVSLRLESLWLYLTAPFLGAALAVPVAGYILGGHASPSPSQGDLEMKNDTSQPPKRVLFVCVENSNRSQMAEGFARLHGAGRVEAYSAGSHPSGKVNPRAVEFMREVGYDLTPHHSKSLTDLPTGEFEAVVGMGCGDEGCPLVKAKRHEEWGIPDPKNLPPEEYRAVRDQIERKVKDLLAGL